MQLGLTVGARERLLALPPAGGENLGGVVIDHPGVGIDRAGGPVVRTGIDRDGRAGCEPGDDFDVQRGLSQLGTGGAAVNDHSGHRHMRAVTRLIGGDV